MAKPHSKKTYLSMEQFMRLAIDFEAESAAFYRSMQGPELEAEARELLRQLEGQEREHEEILRGYQVDPRDPGTLQFAPELSLSMPSPPANPDFAAMLRLAIAREEKSARIYRVASEMTVAGFRELLEGLAAFEEEHERRLRGLLRSRGL
jgi:rubrerythrin